MRKTKIFKGVIVLVVIFILGAIYLDVNYNLIGPGEKLYCYVFPFMTPKETSAVNIPIGVFAGEKQDISAVKEVNLDYQAAWYISVRDNNPNAILPFTVNLPESNSVDPSKVPNYVKDNLLKLHLWDGKGKINFFALYFKEGSILRKQAGDACVYLLNATAKYPVRFKDAVKKAEYILKNHLDVSQNKNFINSISDETERKILANLLFIAKTRGIIVRNRADIENLTDSESMLKRIVSDKDLNVVKEKIRSSIADSVIGIKISGGRAILVYGIPDGYYTQVRMFAKVKGVWKLYNIQDVKHTKALDRALADYWEKKLAKKH